jgi:hypothetical protein
MYGLRRANKFFKGTHPTADPRDAWNTLRESHGDIYMGSKQEVQARKDKLNAFYRHIPIEMHKFTERELEEIVILKLKG